MSQPLVGSSVVAQVGFLVHDIEASSRAWAEFLGCAVPAWSITDAEPLAQTKYQGQPSQARAKLAFFDVGPGLQLELIEPDHEPSTWRHDLDQNGEGFHHLAFVINGMKQVIRTLENKGIPLVQTGEYPGGRYAYLDAKAGLKTMLELLEND